MIEFTKKIDLGSLKVVLVIFVVLSLILTATGYLFLKDRESEKVDILNQKFKIRLAVSEKKDGLIEDLNKGRLNLIEYLLTGDEIRRYQTLYAINDAMPAYNLFQDAIPEHLRNRELNQLLSKIKISIDSLGVSMMGVLSTDEKLPTISSFNNSDTTIVTVDVIPEIQGIGAERLQNAGIEKQFSLLQQYFLNFDIAFDQLLHSWSSELLSGSNLDILGYFIVFMSVIFLLFIYLFRRSINLAILNAGEILKGISIGELPDKVEVKDDEFSVIEESSNNLIDYLKDASDFAVKIGEGDFEMKFNPKSERDVLGNALLEMRDRLFNVAREDKVRNWMNEGQTQFSNILRQYGDSIKELGDHLVSELVEHLDAIQGGLFIVNGEDEEKHLELLSSYAYGRKKHETRTIQPGEGLVGQVFLEQKFIYVKDVKEDHFYIQSGMGESKPASILIMPLMDEDNIEGVVELGSLRELNKEQIEFVQQVASSIASSLRVSKINHTTRHLLEETRQKAEEMKAQEEELRQNMEELSATQEQMERLRADEAKMRQEIEGRQKMMIDILNKIPEKVFVKDKDGKLILLNQAVADVYGKTIDEMLGTTDFDFFSKEEAQEFREAELKVIEKGEIYYNPEEKFKDKEGNIRILQSKKMPFYISYMNQTGLLGVQLDVTEVQQMEDELKKKEKRLEEIEKRLKDEIDKASGK